MPYGSGIVNNALVWGAYQGAGSGTNEITRN